MIKQAFSSFFAGRNGSISVIAALALPALVGFVSLVAEFGHGLVIQAENQRVADLAAYAGANAYVTSSSTTTMIAAAKSVAALNGISAASVTTTLVTSPRTATNQAVQVKIATSNVLLLAPVLRSGTSLPVNANAYAEVGPAVAPCVVALSGSGVGVTLSGGTAVTAATCTVASNTSVTVPCGTSLTAKSVTYNTTVPSQPCSGITAAVGKTAVTDPLVSNAGILAAQSHAAGLSSLSAPTKPSLPTGFDIDFGYNPIATLAQVALTGCVAVYLGSYNVICPVGLILIPVRNLTVEGGVTVTYNFAGLLNSTLNVSGALTNNGTLTLGSGNVNIAQGLVTGGGTKTTFGAGAIAIGPSTTKCNAAGYYSICNLGTSLTFAGASTFSISSGVYNAGGSTLSLGGSSASNTIAIGAASDGNALYVGGGATTTLGETDSNAFTLVGNVTEGGGTCTTFGVATQHDITGNFSVAGGTYLGAGIYSVGGYIAVGASGGGDVTCSGSTYGLVGSGVTLVTEGLATISGGSCNGASFCIGAGFGVVTLSGPSSGTYKNLVILAPNSGSTGSLVLTEGASSTTLAGAVYFPYGPLTMSGAASIGAVSGQCLQLVAAQITMSGSTSVAASPCFSPGTGSSLSALLVQ